MEIPIFNFFKWLIDKNKSKLKVTQERIKSEFISYINAYKDQNSTMETMYLLIHGLELDVMLLVEKYNLVIDFVFLEENDYCEIQIHSSLENNNYFYITIQTEEGKNILILQDGHEIDADQFTTSEIIDIIIDQIETYHCNDM